MTLYILMNKFGEVALDMAGGAAFSTNRRDVERERVKWDGHFPDEAPFKVATFIEQTNDATRNTGL